MSTTTTVSQFEQNFETLHTGGLTILFDYRFLRKEEIKTIICEMQIPGSQKTPNLQNSSDQSIIHKARTATEMHLHQTYRINGT